MPDWWTRSAVGGSRASDSYARIYAVVRAIPRAKVATYGQVAELAGLSGRARQVGYALHATPEDLEIPWQRVVNAKGEISPRSDPLMEGVQRSLLEAEGVEIAANGRIDLARYRWQPRLHSRFRASPRRGRAASGAREERHAKAGGKGGGRRVSPGDREGKR